MPAPRAQVRKKAEPMARSNGGYNQPMAASALIPFDGDGQSILDEF